MPNVTLMPVFTPEELDLLDEASGVLLAAEFVRRAALAAAKELVDTTTHEERHSGVIPKFELDNQPTTC